MTKPKPPVKKERKRPLRENFSSTRPHLIDTLIPAGEVHILGGPSGAGKTRWLLQMLETFSRGEPVFGFATHPAPYVYVATDRSYASVCETCRDIGIDPETMPIFPALDLEPPSGYSINWLFLQLKEHHPNAKLILLEAIATFVPDGKIADYAIVSKFLRSLSRRCRKEGVTVIGIHHTAKEKEKQGYSSDREKLMGSAGWSGFAETLFVVLPARADDPKSPFRRLTILPRNGPGLHLNFKFDGTGRLVQMSEAEATLAGVAGKARRTPVAIALKEFFAALQKQKRYSFELKEALEAIGGRCARSTIIRQIEDWCKVGKEDEPKILVRTGQGMYRLEQLMAVRAFEGVMI